MTTEEKLKYFEEASLERAREQSSSLLAEHKASLEKIEQEHKDMKKRQASLKIKGEAIRLKRAKNMTLSKKRLEIKRHIIKTHNELKDKLATEVRTLLEEFMTTPDYRDLLLKQIREILAFADGSAVTIYIDPADDDLMPALISASNVSLTLSEHSFLGGTKAIIEDRHVLIDNSFASLLEEEMEKFKFNGGHVHE